MKFKEICDEVFNGEWCKWHKDDEYVRLSRFGKWFDQKGCEIEINRACFKNNTWFLKPSIYVWGVCDDNGVSIIFEDKPERIGGEWENEKNDIDPNLFPKDKPQKFKLVPVD